MHLVRSLHGVVYIDELELVSVIYVSIYTALISSYRASRTFAPALAIVYLC